MSHIENIFVLVTKLLYLYISKKQLLQCVLAQDGNSVASVIITILLLLVQYSKCNKPRKNNSKQLLNFHYYKYKTPYRNHGSEPDIIIPSPNKIGSIELQQYILLQLVQKQCATYNSLLHKLLIFPIFKPIMIYGLEFWVMNIILKDDPFV